MSTIGPDIEESTVQCRICHETTLFRRKAGGPWFCTVCGTRNEELPHPRGGAAGAKVREDRADAYDVPPQAPWQQRPPRRGLLRSIVLIVCVGIAAAAAFVLSSWDSTAQCGPFMAPCTLTVNNHGIWPVRIDTSAIQVDGVSAQATGSGIAGPFGSTTVALYGQSGQSLRTMTTVHYAVGAILGDTFAQTLTLQAESPNTGVNSTPVPAPSPTADLSVLQQGDVHLCLFIHYNAAAVQCLSDDTSVLLTNMYKAQIVWPTTKDGTTAATLQVLQQDGTGTWQVVASAAPAGGNSQSPDGQTQSENMQTLFYPSGANVTTLCNATYMVRVVNADNHQFGQAPVTTSC